MTNKLSVRIALSLFVVGLGVPDANARMMGGPQPMCRYRTVTVCGSALSCDVHAIPQCHRVCHQVRQPISPFC